jgi:hypothetical protein
MTPHDLMDPHAFPWPKRFSLVRENLRHSYSSFYAPAAATNRATHALYNASTGDRVIVLRGFSYSGTTAASIPNVGAQAGIIGASLGLEFPIWRDQPVGNGQHLYVDTATVLPNQFVMQGTSALNFYVTTPLILVVLPPNWSFYFQANAIALTLALSFYWEELRIDDPVLGAIGERG